jgi:hypothetical protein
MKFKVGDKVRIVSKSCGDSFKTLMTRKGTLWDFTGIVEEAGDHGRNCDYVVGQNFFMECDLEYYDLIESGLFEI